MKKQKRLILFTIIFWVGTFLFSLLNNAANQYLNTNFSYSPIFIILPFYYLFTGAFFFCLVQLVKAETVKDLLIETAITLVVPIFLIIYEFLLSFIAEIPYFPLPSAVLVICFMLLGLQICKLFYFILKNAQN